MARVILHVDMDAFFASVEQRDNPAYRGKPLIVGSPPDRRGVVCAASYEARQFKVRSAMPSRTAGRLCPHGIFVRPRMEAYRAESLEVMKILRDLAPKLERVSVDEAYLELPPSTPEELGQDAALEAAVPIAREIKRRIREERQLSASVGIGSNKFLAKLGSDFQKPDGLTVILDRDKVAFLRPMAVSAIHGVGPVTAQALQDRGFHTIGDLQDSSEDLHRIVGSFADTLRRRAMGIDDREVDLSEDRKSVSAEHTFPEDTDHRPILRAALKEMAVDVAESLQKHHLAALTVQVKVRYSNFTTLTRQLRVPEGVQDPEEIYRLSCHLLARHHLVTQPLRLLGIGVSTLHPAVREQMTLAI